MSSAYWGSNHGKMAQDHHLFCLHQTLQPGHLMKSLSSAGRVFFQRNPILSKLCQSDTWPVVLQSRSLGSEPQWLQRKMQRRFHASDLQPCLTVTVTSSFKAWQLWTRASDHLNVLVDCRNHNISKESCPCFPTARCFRYLDMFN